MLGLSKCHSGLTEHIQARSNEVKVRQQFLAAEPVGGTPEQLGTFMRAEIDKWALLVKAANMKAD